MAEDEPDLVAEVMRLQAELAASKAVFASHQSYARGLLFCMSKLAEDLVTAKLEAEAARDAEATWRAMLPQSRGAGRPGARRSGRRVGDA